jgi:hypothetical protein
MFQYEKIITHDDFDGLISATICSYVTGIEDIQFASPRSITEARITVTERDIVCDLPYPLVCGMWFDHHEGNLEEVWYRGIDSESIEGRFDKRDSCSRVIFEYFSEKREMPEHFKAMVDEADTIDSFSYFSIEDWRKETPGRIIDCTLRVENTKNQHKWEYLRHCISLLKKETIDDVAERPEVRRKYLQFQNEERIMLQQIQQDITFLSEDTDRRLVILDFTHHKRQPKVQKNLAYLLFPEAEGIIEVKNIFQRNTKTNDLSFSMSLSLKLKAVDHNKDVGDIMRRLNIGSGHKGAGAGIRACSSKREMLKMKEEMLSQILKLYRRQ